MNRREFNTSLAALAATPALPFGVTAATASQSAAVPAGTYAWAELIARAQTRCSPAMLARQLHLSQDVAQQLFNEMLRDGVLRAPGAAGIAEAAKPINATGTTSNPLAKLRRLLPSQESRIDAAPLVKDDPLPLECEKTSPEEDHHACQTQPVQSVPQER